MQENLGKLGPLYVREFPTGLREEIADLARRDGVKVGEFLTQVLLVCRQAGWPRAIADMQHLQTAANGTALAPVDALGGLIAAALSVAQARRQAPRSRLLIAAERHLTARLGG
jgi:hypothetical protein